MRSGGSGAGQRDEYEGKRRENSRKSNWDGNSKLEQKAELELELDSPLLKLLSTTLA